MKAIKNPFYFQDDFLYFPVSPVSTQGILTAFFDRITSEFRNSETGLTRYSLLFFILSILYSKKRKFLYNLVTTPHPALPLQGEGLGGGEKGKFLIE